MKYSLYQSLLNRLRNKHSKLTTRFHKSVKEGEFQKQRYRKRKESIERIKSLEQRILSLGKESGSKIGLNYKHWAVALAMGVVVHAGAQETKKSFKERINDKIQNQTLGDLPLAQTIFFDNAVSLGEPLVSDFHTGDIDNDGDIDAIYISYTDNPIILFNQGGFSFSFGEIPINSPGFIENTQLADFDGDGDLDLFAQDGPDGSPTTSVWLNDGTGNFSEQAAIFPALDMDEDKLRLADIDADGDLDFIGETRQISTYYSYVTVFRNNAFDFSDTTAYAGAYVFQPSSKFIGVMDADGDNDIDILYTAYLPSMGSPLQVLNNNGSGTFADSGSYTYLSGITIGNHVDTLDIDNDGDTDLITTLNYTYPSVTVIPFLNNGSGVFTQGAQVVIPQNQDGNDLISLDMNGDSFDDFVVQTGADSVFIYQGDGVGNFSQLAKFPGEAKPADLDNDSDGDLFFFDGNISILDNQGAGSFVQGADIITVSSSYDTDLVDIDGDGDLDLVQGSQNQSRVWINDGSGNFSVGQEIGKQGFSQVFGDLDGDGDPDMIRAIEEGYTPGLDIWSNAAGSLAYNSNLGSGSFEFKQIELATLDGDADLDIVAVVRNSSISKYLRTYSNEGGLVFTQSANISINYSAVAIDIGDVDGDTDIDVILSYENYLNGVKTFLNDGAGNFASGTTISPVTPSNLSDVDLIDVDGDGDLDVFITSNTSHQIFLNDGLGAFAYLSQIISASYVYKSFVGDVDSDGDTDIILGGYISNPKIYVNDGAGVFAFDSDIPAIADDYAKVVLGDLDGDGDQDVALGGYYTGTKIFLNQAIVPAPEINIQGGGIDIVSGDTTPDTGDGTDFGTVTIGAPSVVSFTIQNTGSADLTVSSLSISGVNASDFTISNITTPSVISGTSDLSFDVTFNPPSVGTRVATIEITNDDSDEALYTFDITGIGQTPPEINIQGGGLDIASGDSTPDAGDGTDFGTIVLGAAVTNTFTIQNTGDADLNVSTIAISGTNATDFAISNITTPAIISGTSDITFDVTYAPLAIGTSIATLEITNDDADEATYTFDVTGISQNAQEINIQGGGIDIVSGDITPDTGDGTDFGSVNIGSSITNSFEIQNTGDADLNISSIAITGGNASDYIVSNITLPAIVSGTSSMSFDITFTPSVSGSAISTVIINNDDADEFSYVFDISGTGQSPQEINIQGNGFDITSGDTTPDVNDGTDFAIVTIGSPVVTSFSIQNSGEADLSITSIDVTGVNASDFTVSNIVTPTSISGLTSTTFDLTFNPTVSGVSIATVEINNDDADEGTYTFDLIGTGQTAREINVQGGGLDIVSGDNTPDTGDGTDFGTVIIGGSTTSTFTIQNTGEEDLDIGAFGITGANAADFAIANTSLPGTVSGTSSATFDIVYTPVAEGVSTATVEITNDDSDEPSYTFDLSGVGTIDLLETDSLAIVNFYNANNGANWTTSSNWLQVGQDIDTWFGVTLNTTGDRVEAIELPNNGLSGTLSNDLNTLDALITLDLSNNDIDALGTDFSGLTGATSINLNGNQLDFGDLEPVAAVSALTYANQQEIEAINEIGPIEIPAGTNQILTTSLGGTSNLYQWVLNGADLTGETNASINITNIGRSNMGTYDLIVTNSIVTGLTLDIAPIDVLATAVISVDVNDVDTETNITENVNAYLFQVNTGAAVDTLDRATLLDVASSFSFPAVVLGDFLVAVESTIPLTDENGDINDAANYVPTYYGDVFESELADVLELNSDVPIQIVMTEVPPVRTPATGSGVVGGSIDEDFPEDGGRIDARRRAAQRKCGLKKRRSGGRTGQGTDEFDLIAYGETNSNGEFEYGFLPVGTYRFFVEYPGIPLDDSAFVQFDVGEAGVTDDSFVLAVFASPDGIQIELILGITSKVFTDFNIYPNPTSDYLTIEYSKIKSDQMTMDVVDLNGKILMTQSLKSSKSKLEIDTSEWTAGQYIIRFTDSKDQTNNSVFRLIKN